MSDARTDARTHPPSEQRIAEARRAGHVPRTESVGLAAAVLGLVLGLALVGSGLEAGLAQLWRGPLSALASGEQPSAAAALAQAFSSVGGLLAWLLIAIGSSVALATFLAQGPAFGFPSERRRERFHAPTPGRLASVLAALGSLGAALGMLAQSLRVTPPVWHATLAGWLLRLSLVLLACGVIDVAFARARFLRGLWLTRREQRDELREAYGSPELRALRDRVRREAARAEQP